jgi:RNA polymerase sigma factor for flagellar operon FliA
VGVKFETYAVPRIRGAILDELRSLDWLPRSVRANHRRIERAVHQASQENGREAIDTEIAGKLEMTLDEFRAFVAECSGPTAARHGSQRKESPAETLEAIPAHTANPFEKLSDDESKEFLVQAVSQLPTRERSIIALYYYEGLKFGEIGSILHISESRVSQIHAEVLRDLRQKLNSLQ